MGILIQPQRWTMKPPIGAQINWGHPLTNGLVANWLMNEAGGERLNDSLFLNNGILSGSTLPSWRTGPYGPALSFDGVTGSGYIDVGNKASLDFPGALTIVSFINTATLSGFQRIIANFNSNGNLCAWSLGVLTGQPRFEHGGSFSINGSTLTTGRWYRIGVVRSGASGNWSVTVYVNGVSDAIGTTASDPAVNQVIAIGRPGA